MEHDLRIAYLGPAGTYSDEAARAFAKRLGCVDPELVECASFPDVFEAVERGKTAFGVVPTENALEGPVTAVLDEFAFDSQVQILGEHILDIHHCLLLHPEATMAEVDTVASHPQGIAQCRRFLHDRLAGRRIATTSSTAESARLAAENRNIAGIGNAYAASLYGAKVAERQIEDHFGNQTRFALIAHVGTAPVLTGSKWKTSLVLFLKSDKTGALLMILSEFAYANVNLTKIQSRPTKHALGEYLFFIDIEGSANDPDVQTALNCLRLKLREVKVLGSYPVE